MKLRNFFRTGIGVFQKYSAVKGPVKSKKVIVLLVLGQRVFHWLNIAGFAYTVPDTDPRLEPFFAAAMEFAEGFHRATEIFYQYLEEGEKRGRVFHANVPRGGEGPEFENVGMFMRWFGSPESMWYLTQNQFRLYFSFSYHRTLYHELQSD